MGVSMSLQRHRFSFVAVVYLMVLFTSPIKDIESVFLPQRITENFQSIFTLQSWLKMRFPISLTASA